MKQTGWRWMWLLGSPLLLLSCSHWQAAEKNGDAALEQARLYAARGQDDEAIRLLQPLVEANPRQPQYKNWLSLLQEKKLQKQLQEADSLLQAKQYDAAMTAYEQVLQAAPNNRAASDGLQKVTQARQHDQQLMQVKSAIAAEDWAGAEFGLRTVLAEQPAQPEARQLFEQLEQKKNERSSVVRPLQSSLKKKVTLELKNAPIKQAFEYLGKAGDLNFSFDQELSDGIRVNVLLRDTPIEQALEVILTSHQLGKKILNSNTLLIYPQSRAAQYEELFVRSFYLTHMDAKRALNMMKTVLRASDVYMDEKLNTLVIRDTLDRIKVAEKLIASQDLNEPEVMLEVEVMEINRRNLENLGIQYPSQIGVGVQGNAAGSTSGTQPQAGKLTLTELRNFNGKLGVFSINDPAVVLNLLHQDTDTNLLASPKIRVKNRDRAKIHVGDKIPVLTSVASAQGFVSQNVNYIEVGIKLDVEPVIQMQDQVSIKVGMEVSNITDQVTTSSGVLAYTIGSRNANTTLQLRNNETQILAGLFRDDEQRTQRKVPGLANLPLIGRLFSNNNQDKRKNEIVLLITPRIMHNLSPANAVYSLIPSGVAATANPVGAGGARTVQAVDTTPPAAPVVTPQSTQSSNVRNDSGFANQMMNSTDGGAVQP
ncbi:type II and III secretion system protein [Methylophilus sp. VKM B-3414]|uniref:tetratricopeptide repeat protein n=1 Tax=Methylophilus sp. VKM B-3414 TaxID=3076121 RepID=UPI0028C7FA37|nr:type II and III secretion system protein [Methylophilus sp. VKM B-3414]MDT7849639.1 type II and III secretion system protein [Methylophilus sp. VKM B-3414]